MSESTFQFLENAATIEGRLKVKLKGVAEPVWIYDVVNLEMSDTG